MRFAVLVAALAFAVAPGVAYAQDPEIGSPIRDPASEGPILAEPVAPDPAIASEYSLTNRVDLDEARRRLLVQARAADIVDVMRTELGSTFAGVWFDNRTGRLHVAATNAADRTKLNAALLERRVVADTDVSIVRNSEGVLGDAQRVINKLLAPLILTQKVTTSVDAQTNGVLVWVANNAPLADVLSVRLAARAVKVPLVVRSVAPEKLKLDRQACAYPNCDRPLRGGVALFNNRTGDGCTAGFIAVGYGNLHLLTAGHCGAANSTYQWQATHSATGTARDIGPTGQVIDNALGDFQRIRIEPTSFWVFPLAAEIAAWNIDEHYPIYARFSSYQGLNVCRFGATTRNSCGVVEMVNAPAVAADGILRLAVTYAAICTSPGDSGGPVASSVYAYGIATAGIACGAPGNQSTIYHEVKMAELLLGVRLALAG